MVTVLDCANAMKTFAQKLIIYFIYFNRELFVQKWEQKMLCRKSGGGLSHLIAELLVNFHYFYFFNSLFFFVLSERIIKILL